MEEKDFDLDEGQKGVVEHGYGPLWVVAGPGSGKTEVLVLRTLKLIFVDNLPPESIIITTFTEKAAKNLFDRIINYSNLIISKCPELEKLDIQDLKVGTLHSLCNDIMLEHKYPYYENYRLLDELEQYLFIFEHSEFVNDDSEKYSDLYEHFDYLFEGYDPVTNSQGWDKESSPNKWKKTNAAIKLFNRAVEDYLDLEKIINSNNIGKLFIDSYQDYVSKLENNKRCDFAHLQEKFLEFLDHPLGDRFLNGDEKNYSGIKYVLVDEYQDTNPIQEAIYLKLTENSHNLCVVGDDDQALYRFRGGTVDCMISFRDACVNSFGIKPEEVKVKFLNTNYRSHPNIVYYYDDYIKSFRFMRLKGARVEGKPTLIPDSDIHGDYPSVAYITGDTIESTAKKFANFVDDLLKNKVIEKPSQCALLMRSVRESQYKALHFANALRDLKIPVYNPRSKSFLEQEEIECLMGAFVSIIDPGLSALKSIIIPNIRTHVIRWVDRFNIICKDYPELSHYINKSVSEISEINEGKWVGVNILDIFYRILAHEPFNQWKDDVEKTYRLGHLSKIFEIYASVPYMDDPGSNRGKLKISKSERGKISFRWRTNFYYSLIGMMAPKGLDDPEDEQIITPPDHFPIMTVHQAKGLQFPFTFVYGLNQKPKKDDSILLEDEFANFRKKSKLINLSVRQRSEQDLVRFFYVAYSRAQNVLIHIVPKEHFSTGNYGFINKMATKFKDKAEEVGY